MLWRWWSQDSGGAGGEMKKKMHWMWMWVGFCINCLLEVNGVEEGRTIRTQMTIDNGWGKNRFKVSLSSLQYQVGLSERINPYSQLTMTDEGEISMSSIVSFLSCSFWPLQKG